MKNFLLPLLLALAPLTAVAQDDVAAHIIALEKAALDRWNAADPQGYLDLYTPEMTYFDPSQDARLDGIEAMKTYYAPLFGAQYPFTKPRYEMLNPLVQHYGEVAVLSFNLVNYATFEGQGEAVIARWNSTEVYRLVEGRWMICHSHWSYIKSEVPDISL
jgi:ketosteroid isomerase-like protein